MTSTPRATGLQPWLVAAIALLLVLVRMPDRVVDGFLWAEDGKIFLRDAYMLGAASLFKPYAQYLHLLPRAFAWFIAGVCRIDQVARPLAWICALTLGAACAWLFVFARRRLSLRAAWLFALAPLLIPHTGEVWLTITNLQWILAPALLALLWDSFCSVPAPPGGERGAALRGGKGGAALRGAAVVVLTLTGPFGLIFAPLIAAALLARRRVHRPRGTWIAIGAYFAAAAIQLGLILTNPPAALPPGSIPPAPLAAFVHYPWISQLAHHLALDFVLPDTLTGQSGGAWRLPAAALACLLLACLMLAGRTCRLVAAGLLLLAASLWAMGVLRLGIPNADMRWQVVGRYFYVPFVAMAWSLLVIHDTALRSSARALAGVLLALVLINSLTHFRAAVWQPVALSYRHETQEGVLRIPPSYDWFLPVRPEWTRR